MPRREITRDSELEKRVNGYRNALFQSGAVKVASNQESLFTLRNGDRSWIFVDHGLLLTNPSTNKAFVDVMSYAIQAEFPQAITVLANVDSKSSPQTTGALSYKLGYRQIAVNPETTTIAEHGIRLRLRMPDVKQGDTILIIDDVMVSKDTTALNIAQQIRHELGEKADGVRIHLLVGLLRDSKAAGELARQGITLHNLITLKELMQNEWGQLQLTDEQQEGLKREIQNIVI